MTTTVRLTLAEYDRMIANGVFDESGDQHIELIHGELHDMTPLGPTHEEVVDLLNDWGVLNVSPQGVRVRIQNSIGIPELDSAPQPDVAWVRKRSYRSRRPRPEDVLLVIEVAKSSLGYDCGAKAGLYASAGVQDYWVVDIIHQCVEVFREPHGAEYWHVKRFDMGHTVQPLAFPELQLPVSALFETE